MANSVYEFPCGCRWPVLEESADPDVMPLLDFDVEKAPPSCPATWEILARGLTKGVFQLESSLGRTWCKKLKPQSGEHMGALGALLRPGPLKGKDEDGVSMTEHYTLRKNGEEAVESYHEALDPILGSTYNVLVYQEQMMRIAREICGFDLIGEDKLRKCVTGDTRFVSKQRGWISIDTLLSTGYTDDEFLVMDERGRSCWKRLDKIWSTGKQAARRVESQSGKSVWATKYHQFLTTDGWKARSRLDTDDFLVCARRVEFDGVDAYSADIAAIIASVVTEGHFVAVRRGTFVSHDRDFMDLFQSACRAAFGHECTESPDGKTAYINSEMRDRLLACGLKPGLSGVKQLPEWMMGTTYETMRRFLSVILGAEGGSTLSSGQFEFSSKSRDFVEQVQLLLLRFGVRSYLLEKSVEGYPEPYWRLYVNDIRDQKKIAERLTDYWPQRKRDDFLKVIESKGDGNYSTDVVPRHLAGRFIDQYPWTARHESGTAYTANLTRERFLRLAERSGDQMWLEIASGPQCYEQVASTNEKWPSVATYDFTVAGGDTPYIVANGLVIHNSVGKKDQKALAQVRDEFLAGAARLGIVNEVQAKTIWSWIQAAGRYAFNKSHAVSYGLTGYDTAYGKAHFPLAFFTAWLRNAQSKPDTLQEIRELVQEAKLFDVTVVVPDLRHREARFHTDRKVVRFGLTDVKGIGQGQMSRLEAAVAAGEAAAGKELADMTWLEVLTTVLPHVGVGVMASLIRVGALDWVKLPRQRMLAEHRYWMELTDNEQAWVLDWLSQNPQGSLAASLRALSLPRQVKERTLTWREPKPGMEDHVRRLEEAEQQIEDGLEAAAGEAAEMLGAELKANRKAYLKATRLCKKVVPGNPPPYGGCASDRRSQVVASLATLLERPTSPLLDTPNSIAMDEERLLGIPISCSYLDSCDLSQVTCSCKEFLSGRTGYTLLGVQVDQVREVRTKKGKDPGATMAFLTVSDDSCALGDVVCFPDVWKEFSQFLRAGERVVIQGERDGRQKDSQVLVVSRVWRLERAA